VIANEVFFTGGGGGGGGGLRLCFRRSTRVDDGGLPSDRSFNDCCFWNIPLGV